MRFFERRWPLETTGDDRLIGVDRVYTVLNKLGIVPLAIFIVTYPITQEIELLMRGWGYAPPRLERLLPWLGDNALASFLVYFVLYDFAAYWLHRAQHALRLVVGAAQPASQPAPHDRVDRRPQPCASTTCWSPWRWWCSPSSSACSPASTSLILMVGRLIESWSHANVDMSFGRLGERLLVGPRFHRLHHALANPDERAYPRPQFRAGVPDLGHPVRHGDLRRQAPSDRRRRSRWSMPTTAAAGSPSR